MATKLSKAQVERLKNIGIVAKTGTVEEASKKLLDYLSKNELQGVEGSPLDELIEMAEVFYEPSAAVEEAEEEVEEEETEEAEEEAEEEVEEEEAEEEAEEEVEEEEADEEEELDELAEEVAEEEEEAEEEAEEEEEPAPAPVKKAPAKTAAKPAPAAPVKKAAPAAPTAPAKKAAASAPAVKKGGIAQADGERFDARNNEAHKAFLKPFQKFFPKEDFAIDILKQGFTIRSLGSNAKITIMNYDELRIVDGKLIGNLYANRFESADDFMTVLPEDYHEREIGMFRGESHPSIKKFTQDELVGLLGETEFLKTSLERAGKKDNRMGVNRQKLEDSMKASKAAPAPAKKAAAPAEPKAGAFNKSATKEWKEGSEARKVAAVTAAPAKKAAAPAPAKKAAAPVQTEPVLIKTEDLGGGRTRKTYKNPDGTTSTKVFVKK